ncbi:MAG: hypothetical protein AAFY71_23025 [Bacteroidota bacterium]
MKTQHLTQVRSFVFLYLFLSIASTGFLLLGISLFARETGLPYTQIEQYIPTSVCLLLSMSGFLGLLCISEISYDEDIIVKKTLLGLRKKVFSRSQMAYFTIFSGKHGDELCLHFPHGKVQLNPYNHQDLNQHQERLTTGRLRNRYQESLIQYRVSRAFIIVIFLLCLTTSYSIWGGKTPDYKPIKQEELVLLEGHLEHKPQIEKYRGDRSIDLKMVEYPLFTFSFDDLRYNSLFRGEFFKHMDKGSQVWLSISKDAYDLKIAKTKEPSFKEKHVGYGSITPYGIQDTIYQYFSLEHYNGLEVARHQRVQEVVLPILGGIMSIATLTAAIFLLRLKKPQNPYDT